MKKIIAMTMAAGLAAEAWAGTGASFLKINPSVRGEALGGWNPAAVRGAGALGVNPANAVTEDAEFTSGFASLIGNSAYGTLGLTSRRSPSLTVGAGLTFLQSANIQGRDAAGNPTDSFNERSYAAGLTAAWGDDSFRVGVTGKGVREQIGPFTSNTALAGDAGLGFKAGGLDWGFAALNLGSGIKFQGGQDALPTIYSLGAGVPLGGGLTGLAGVEHLAKEGQTFASVGLEYQLKPLVLRLGYRNGGLSNLAAKGQGAGAQALEGLTGGLGVAFGNLRVDYAVSQSAVEYGMSHRAAVTFKWGGEDGEVLHKQRPAPKKTLPRKTLGRNAPKSDAGVTTGSRRAYDPAPVERKKSQKRWVD